MSVNVGYNTILQFGDSTVVCFRTLQFQTANTPLDIGDSCSGAFRVLARVAGERRLTFTVEGIAKHPFLRAHAFNGEVRVNGLMLIFPDGDIVDALDINLTEYSESAPYNEMATFSATMEVSGPWVYIPFGGSSSSSASSESPESSSSEIGGSSSSELISSSSEDLNYFVTEDDDYFITEEGDYLVPEEF